MPSTPLPRHRVLLLALLVLTLPGCAMLGLDEEPASRDGGPPPVPKVAASFEGLDARQEANARAYLGLLEEPCDAAEWRVRRRFAAADDDIRRGLRALGHYAPRVDKRLERGEACWQASFAVDPGPQVVMAQVEVTLEGEAREDPAFKRLLADLPLRAGEPLDHGAYERSKSRLASLASERGYLDAKLTRHELIVDPDAGTAQARLQLSSGPRYRLGELKVVHEGIRHDLVRRLLEYTPGEPYSADRLHLLDRALSDSGYFSSVDVRADTQGAQDLEVPVTVTAQARKRHLYSAGVGFATDVGPRVRLGYENRRVNAAGHRVVARLRGSLVQSDLSVEYRIPLQRPQSEWLTFSAAAVREDTDTFESTSGKLGVRATRLRGRWLETSFVELSRDNFEVGRTRRTSTLLMPGLSYSRTQSDGRLRPDEGWRLYAEIKGGAEALLSDTDVLRTRISGGWLRTLPWDGRIITRAEVGALIAGDFDALPPSVRFFAGGDTSIRGYEFESLGPKDDFGEVIGGRYLGVVSLEYEHPIKGPWSAAVFMDAGNAFDNEFSQDIKTGVGVGLRWQSPVGPVRVDIAHPLNDDGDTLFRLHLRLGPDL